MRSRHVGGWVLLLTSCLVTRPAGGQNVLTETARAEVIARVLARIDARYVFPDLARKMRVAIDAKQRAGRYAGITDPVQFAEALTADLREVSQDGHLRVISRRTSQPNNAPSRRSGPLARHEVLDGNVGYLYVREFARPDRLSPEIDAAMRALAGTDALILDLRENPGGTPLTVMHLAGYLFPERTLVARIYSRPEESTTEMWTSDVPGPKYLDKPVLILTSRVTFSAAEAAAYHLKHLGRARTVGDTTGGGAHRVDNADMGHGFTAWVPFTRPMNVVTQGDWEGVGVIPDIPVTASEALRAAHAALLRSLPSTPERSAALTRLAAPPR